MIGFELEGPGKCLSGPGVFLAGQIRVPRTDIQFDRGRVNREPILQDVERFVVTALIVELVGLLVELVGAPEYFRHPAVSPVKVPVT